MKSKIRSDILARKWTGEGLVAHYFLALAAYAFGFDRGVARKRRWSAFRVAARLDFASSLNHPTSRLTVVIPLRDTRGVLAFAHPTRGCEARPMPDGAPPRRGLVL
jgi:hypothetical protein